jgi:hypothetical protein
MDQNSRTILLEAMEQQTISIAKAGIVCQLNSRTAILAAANPVHSKYDPKKSVVENINLPPALLSRFDLIYIMLDLPNEASDKLLASHILDIYSNKHRLHIKYSLPHSALACTGKTPSPSTSATPATTSCPSSPKRQAYDSPGPTCRCGSWATTRRQSQPLLGS